MRQFTPLVRLLQPGALVLPLPMPHRAVVMAIRSIFAEPDRLPDAWYDSAADEHRRVMRGYAHRRAFYSAMREIYLDAAYGDDGFWERLPTLAPPAMFVWGDRDWVVPASFAQHVTSALPQAESVVLSDCGHVPHFEQPEETVALIRRFLTG
jgi:pimeloyl-ACP methyl ester carboxylesterase